MPLLTMKVRHCPFRLADLSFAWMVVAVTTIVSSTRGVVSWSPTTSRQRSSLVLVAPPRAKSSVSSIGKTFRPSHDVSLVMLNMASGRRLITKCDEDTIIDFAFCQRECDSFSEDFTASTNLITANNEKITTTTTDDLSLLTIAFTTSTVGLMVLSEAAHAAIEMPKSLQGSFDPSSFVPVCAASDGFYRFLQSSTQTIVGRENFIEYGPLIASGLLRVRLELCVVESFFNEAVGPFIRQNGLSWVLPLHETVETFLAGTVFALATTFILVGSTKLLTVIFTYADFLVGAPLRFFGGYIFDRSRGKPVTVDIGLGPFKTRVIGPKDAPAETNKYDYSIDMDKVSPGEIPIVVVSGSLKVFGQAIGLLRETLDAIDLFVGKSLVLWVTFYVLIKFLHFKVFPDFP